MNTTIMGYIVLLGYLFWGYVIVPPLLVIGVIRAVTRKRLAWVWLALATIIFGIYLVHINYIYGLQYAESRAAAEDLNFQLLKPTLHLDGWSRYKIDAHLNPGGPYDPVEIIIYSAGGMDRKVWIRKAPNYSPTSCNKLYELSFDEECTLVGQTPKGYSIYSRVDPVSESARNHVFVREDVWVTIPYSHSNLDELSKYVDAMQPSELPIRKFHFYPELNQ